MLTHKCLFVNLKYLKLGIEYVNFVCYNAYNLKKVSLYMAKQQVIELDNGATLIYQKQSVFNGNSFVIGFRSGAQLDGKYKGISHVLEHMLFNASEADFSKNILNNILKYSINQNAYTTNNYIVSTFSATHNNIEMALTNNVKLFTNTKFTQQQIDKELEVIKQEMIMYKNEEAGYAPSAFESVLSSLKFNQPVTRADLIGNNRTLKMITPEILDEYAKRYFNLDNMIISVTSNRPLSEVQALCEKHIFSQFKNASDERFIVPYPEFQVLNPINILCAIPDEYSQNISIDFVLRERDDFASDPEKEFAYNVVEEYVMNSMGGILESALRVHNNLVYTFGCSNIDFGASKIKVLECATSAPKLRKTISTLCETIKYLGANGISEELFNDVKNALVDQQNASLQKFKSCSAYNNFENYVTGIPYIDYKKAMDYIKTMTYQDFKTYITSVYSNPQLSVAVEGNFDSRKMYNLIEIEQMAGNDTHKENKAKLNTPIVQYTDVTTNSPAFILGQLAGGSELETESEEFIEPIKIDEELTK